MKLVCIGDSLTYGYNTLYKNKWTTLVEKNYDIEVVNKGINGDTTTGMISRFYRDVIDEKSTHVLIMGGSNDIIMGVSLENIRSNISTMVHQAYHYGIKPIIGIQIVTQPEMATKYWSNITDFNRVNRVLKEYRSWAYDFTKIFNVPLFDFYEYFNDKIKENPPEQYYMDGLHPNVQGNAIMAECSDLEVIKKLKYKCKKG